ncbi:MAG: Gfo/Idh/MocA family oxidoreductase [Clostridiaceae bacterium]|nr:Gfo/Idh/MocA family oxidoreductase [Clostridiaceae bacterium]
MNIGLVGCGRISKNHFEAIRKVPKATIKGCCDIVKERAKEAAKAYDIPYWTTNFEDLLKQEDIDLISICSPSGLHPAHGIMAANYGKHVLTEKPMGVRLIDVDQLIKACNDNDVRLFVVLQNRLNPSIQIVKKAIDQGRFGKIHMIVANVFWSRPQEYYDLSEWRGTWALDGGAFCNQASHYVDLVQWFGGPVKTVMARTDTLARNIEAEDTGAAIIKFDSGCIATINVTMLTYPKNLEGSVTIIGEKGTVRVGGIAVNEILYWKFSDSNEVDFIIDEFSTDPNSVYGFGHEAYYDNVINSIINEQKPSVDGNEGRKSLELIEAIYTSSKNHKIVNL